MRLKGETVILVTRTGGGVDPDGRRIPPTVERTPLEGCVIIPKAGALEYGGPSYWLASKEISILTSAPVDGVKVGAELEVRGQLFEVNAPVFHHKSPFGTAVGGSEIPAEWKATV